jgi:hypothetical protein
VPLLHLFLENPTEVDGEHTMDKLEQALQQSNREMLEMFGRLAVAFENQQQKSTQISKQIQLLANGNFVNFSLLWVRD